MESRIIGKSKSVVAFIDELKAKVELTNGETWIVGFPTPSNFFSGEKFILQLGWEFDLFWGVNGSIEGDFRLINAELYKAGYEMMTFVVLEPQKTEERKRIGERIKELRKKRNLDAKTLASRVGIDASNLSRIEQGRYSVGFDILSKIANTLHAKVDIVDLEQE